MKDKNGQPIRVGDKVRFFPRSHQEEWYEGRVTHIDMNGKYHWEGEPRTEPTAHIVKQNDIIPIWKRFGSDVEKVTQ